MTGRTLLTPKDWRCFRELLHLVNTHYDLEDRETRRKIVRLYLGYKGSNLSYTQRQTELRRLQRNANTLDGGTGMDYYSTGEKIHLLYLKDSKTSLRSEIRSLCKHTTTAASNYNFTFILQ